jgi:hypothetical protein
VTPRQANLLTLLGLGALFALASLTAPRWARLLREPVGVVDEDVTPEGAGTVPGVSSAAGPEVARQISVRLYFEAPDRTGLVAEERSVVFSSDLAVQIHTVVEELVRGSSGGLLSPLPPETRVLEVLVTARGVAYVSLSKEARDSFPGGSRAELLTVYAIVDTIVANFPSLRRVQILLDDRPVDSFAGHVDLSRPLPPDFTMLAPLPATVAPSPSPAPPASAAAR